MKKILVAEDDLHVGNLLEEALTKAGYSVIRAYSGTEALLLLEGAARPDLVLLDLMLPGMDGEQVLSKIKGVPVIVVSAKADIDGKVDLLLKGAQDYITKPFNVKELLARIAVQLRGIPREHPSMLRLYDISLDVDSHTAFSDGGSVKLTRTECAILGVLMENPGKIVTKTGLLDEISMQTPDCTESSLKMHISNIRKKLRGLCGHEYIEAVWGIGFRIIPG